MATTLRSRALETYEQHEREAAAFRAQRAAEQLARDRAECLSGVKRVLGVTLDAEALTEDGDNGLRFVVDDLTFTYRPWRANVMGTGYLTLWVPCPRCHVLGAVRGGIDSLGTLGETLKAIESGTAHVHCAACAKRPADEPPAEPTAPTKPAPSLAAQRGAAGQPGSER